MFDQDDRDRKEFTDLVRNNNKEELENIRPDGHTALSFAAFKGYNLVIKEILEKGVDPHKKVNVDLNGNGKIENLSPLEIAERKFHFQCQNLLRTAELESANQKNRTKPNT
jgi:hypothetical protein